MRNVSIGNPHDNAEFSYPIECEIVSVDLARLSGQTDRVFHLGTLVRQLRKARNQTIVELSKRAGVNKNTWSRFERTGVRFEDDTLSRIATALELTPRELYALESEQRVRLRTAMVDQLAGNKDVASAPQQIYPAAPHPSPGATEAVTEGEVEMADDPEWAELRSCFSLLPADGRHELLQHARALTARILTERFRGGSEAHQRKKAGRH